jgi:hypothetical protein
MTKFSRLACVLALAPSIASYSTAAFAWGDSGHRMIGMLAVEALPDSVPAFLRTEDAASDIGEWAREPDRWRNAGLAHDDMRDPGHFVDVDDDGRIPGGPMLDALPQTRADYIAMLAANGVSMSKIGFLPYNIIDGYQQVAKDFTLWRADTAALRLDNDPAHRIWFEADLKRREEQTRMDIGIWGHYVGDASQPMHVSVHYNGWGDFPNPEGFTNDPIHIPWEGSFVRDNVSLAAVRAAMKSFKACDCAVTLETERYLEATQRQVIPLFSLIKAGGMSSRNAPLVAFTTERVAAGASELRDLICAAWEASASGTVGFPVTAVNDIESGKAEAWPLLHGSN